jgi:hypothetical protein
MGTSETRQDTRRAREAASAMIDGRDPKQNMSGIMVTTEHAIATVLLYLFPDPGMAAKVLNEGLVQGIEERLVRHASNMKPNGR